jgi:hypothetical protein
MKTRAYSIMFQKMNKDRYGGMLICLIGGAIALKSLAYHVGSLRRMGPGCFPVILGVVLMFLGVAIALTAKPEVSREPLAQVQPEWRGWLCICLGIVAFVILGRYGGLLPATFAVVFISALGDRKNTLKSALGLSFAMSVLSVVVFSWALKLQLPLFQWG